MGAQASAAPKERRQVTLGQGENDKTIPVLAMPYPNAPVIGRIPCGDQAKLITDNGDFMRVSWNENDLTGWVDRRSIDLEEEAAQAAVEAVRHKQEKEAELSRSASGIVAPAHKSLPPQCHAEGKPQALSRGAVQPRVLAAAWSAPPEARASAAEAALAVVAAPILPTRQVEFAVPQAISMVQQVPVPAMPQPQGLMLNQLNACTTMEQSNARKEAMERATVPELPQEVAAIFAHLSQLPGGGPARSHVPAF